MICPSCGSENLKVNESRDLDGGSAIRRRRQCLSCDYRFTTYERIENPGLLVIKRSGAREAYSRDKVLLGVEKALEKRSRTSEEIENIVKNIDHKIHLLGKAEIESSIIGDIVLEELKCIDDVAYLRFASVYKDF
ncbi:MAG: transcriptional regulator NrdR, partial [Patescibacteria group bacterium]|nr:transcriptional regulator NrdR [Patescibacteria group bacterium]